ncbi:MAG TPA: 16S rRNA (cytidine(1402)-2'-O)-methyltransferase [Polyangiaceae bacterium]|nr:16S rRNA (cytidine(1402)-2'-O)-methyltransferase [Polyangiaceae bacterium]
MPSNLETKPAGTLYVIATPIGNLSDITPRAVEALKECEVICAEDTRRTRALLTHLGIHHKRVQALHAHSSERAVAQALEQVRAGTSVGLVTDAGTPCVSDPGTELIRACHREGLQVISVPGPSAVTTAIAASGLVNGAFLFLGFLPRKGAKRTEMLERIAVSEEPCVLFEAPGRVGHTLSDLAALMPEREACVARELSKLHEEVRVDTLSKLAALGDNWRGECTLVVAAAPEQSDDADDSALDDPALMIEIKTALDAGASTKALADVLAQRLGRSRKELYSLVLKCRDRAGSSEEFPEL